MCRACLFPEDRQFLSWLRKTETESGSNLALGFSCCEALQLKIQEPYLLASSLTARHYQAGWVGQGFSLSRKEEEKNHS
jgi:hypothetical protein